VHKCEVYIPAHASEYSTYFEPRTRDREHSSIATLTLQSLYSSWWIYDKLYGQVPWPGRENGLAHRDRWQGCEIVIPQLSTSMMFLHVITSLKSFSLPPSYDGKAFLNSLFSIASLETSFLVVQGNLVRTRNDLLKSSNLMLLRGVGSVRMHANARIRSVIDCPRCTSIIRSCLPDYIASLDLLSSVSCSNATDTWGWTVIGGDACDLDDVV